MHRASMGGWAAGAALAIGLGYATETAVAGGETTVSGLRVLDRTGGPLVSVGAASGRGLKLYAKGGGRQPVLALLADGGGEFTASTPTGNRSVRLNAESLRFVEQFPAAKKGAPPTNRNRALIGAGTKGSWALVLRTADGKFMTGVGASEAQTGLIVVSDPGGTPRAAMSVSGGKGRLAVVDERMVTSFVQLTEGANGGGRLEVTDANNVVVVEAGVTSGGVGVVRAGPRPIPTIGTMGSSPSTLVGR